MANPPGYRFSRGTGYETIHQPTQQDELTDRKSWNDDDCEGARCRREHPVGDLIESALWLSDQEVVDAAMLVIANHQHRLPSERMKRIGDNGFECQKPGIMAPARTAAGGIGQSSPP